MGTAAAMLLLTVGIFAVVWAAVWLLRVVLLGIAVAVVALLAPEGRHGDGYERICRMMEGRDPS